MSTQMPDILDNPHVGWLSGRLSHKALVTIGALAVLSGFLMCCTYLWYISAYADNTYRRMAQESDNTAAAAAECLVSGSGDFTELQQYAEQQEFSCEVSDRQGKLLSATGRRRNRKGFRPPAALT